MQKIYTHFYIVTGIQSNTKIYIQFYMNTVLYGIKYRFLRQIIHLQFFYGFMVFLSKTNNLYIITWFLVIILIQ